MSAPVIVWFRNDLRIHDHEPLHDALRSGRPVVPAYCFDPRHVGSSPFGFPRTGPFRARFLVEAVSDLRDSLRRCGGDLWIGRGRPEIEMASLARKIGASQVFYHTEVASEEAAVERSLRDALRDVDVGGSAYLGATLFHPEDLPFHIETVPEVFTSFRRAVEKSSTPRPALGSPDRMPALPDLDVGTVPTLAELNVPDVKPDPRGVLRFVGGERAALDRVGEYLWTRDRLRRYKETRNGMLGPDDSSKFSPWLAHGCLSPRRIYEEVGRYEAERVANQSTYWLIFELLWRDYFRFICAKHGRRVFYRSGLRGLDVHWRRDDDLERAWQDGETGYPLVDANMRELSATGFMSNRGRQNVASFLTKNLGLDWRLGAEWFESLLIDYDVCSNWGNWNYTAGVGNDARGFRYFNIAKQSRDYDPRGEYVKHWLPELAKVPGSKVHEPWLLTREEQRRAGLDIGTEYPRPVVDFDESLARNRESYERAVSGSK